jgi:hypothetical protein
MLSLRMTTEDWREKIVGWSDCDSLDEGNRSRNWTSICRSRRSLSEL